MTVNPEGGPGTGTTGETVPVTPAQTATPSPTQPVTPQAQPGNPVQSMVLEPREMPRTPGPETASVTSKAPEAVVEPQPPAATRAQPPVKRGPEAFELSEALAYVRGNQGTSQKDFLKKYDQGAWDELVALGKVVLSANGRIHVTDF